MLGHNGAEWPDLVRPALENVKRDTSNVGSFYFVPEIECWDPTLEHHDRVVILGDAAHAVPPTAGQGPN